MSPRGRAGRALPIAIGSLVGVVGLHGQDPDLDRLATAFWLAPDSAVRAEIAADFRETASSFELAYQTLRRPPDFPRDVAVGRLDRTRVAANRVFPYTVLIPESYDPAESHPVLVYLHGGVNRPLPEGGGWWRDYDRIADDDRIVVVPAAWDAATWWDDEQIRNVGAIVRELGRTYHIDTDRIHLLGVSDGGTGVYYQAFRAPTPWASFLPFIGHPAVLSSPRLGVEGQMYVTNLRNRPLMIVNGGRDRLYPTSSVEPFIRLFREHDVRLVYRPHEESGHDLSWWPDEASRIDSFLVANKRDPLPDELEWETEDPNRGRFSWIVIDELGSAARETDLPDRNSMTVAGDPKPYLAFPHRRPSGRVVAMRAGNRVEILTRGIRKLRVLIAPEEFDLSEPIQIEVNGRALFDQSVTPDLSVMLEWASRDLDRAMIFAAEISLEP